MRLMGERPFKHREVTGWSGKNWRSCSKHTGPTCSGWRSAIWEAKRNAEDVCQSVFLKLAEGRQGPRPGKEKSWLLTCTANACKSHLRSFWYRNVGELDEAALFRDEEDRRCTPR